MSYPFAAAHVRTVWNSPHCTSYFPIKNASTACAPSGELTGNFPPATATKSVGAVMSSTTTRNRICVEYRPFQSTPASHVTRLSVPAVTEAPSAPVADVTGTVHVTPPSEDTCIRTLIGPFTRDKS
jgi:hypothetical protein